MKPAIVEQLARGAVGIGVAVEAEQVDQLARYVLLLDRWNRRINLTAVRDPAGAVERHVLESLRVVPLLGAEPGRLIDVGSGPGIPGLPIAVARPDLEVTLLEATAKKAAFLRAAIHEMGLTCTVAQARAEEFRPRALFDLAISRATWEPLEWLERAGKLVRPGGAAFVLTGREIPPEAPPGWSRETIVSWEGSRTEERHAARYRFTWNSPA